MPKLRMVVAVVLLAMVCTMVCALAVAQERAQFEGSTTVVAVEIPVNVYRDGEPVRGLTADNFQVLDGGVERAIVDFEVVDLATIDISQSARNAGDAGFLPLPARRHFLLLFDLSFIERNNLLRSVKSARQLLDGALHPSDRVAVGVFGASRGASLLVGFTPNHSQIGGALDALEAILDGKRPESPTQSDGESGDRRTDPLRLFAGGGAGVAADIGRNRGSDWIDGVFESLIDGGGRGGGLLTDTVANMLEVNRVEIAARKESEVLNFTDGLAQLAESTAGIKGRKYLVLFSQGFGLPTGDIYAGGGARVLKGMDRAVAVFRRAGWVLQSVNVSGLNDLRDGSESMLKMARDTGGDLYERFNDLGAAMGRMLSKTSVTYLLTIQAEGVPLDGAFHRLDVRLRDKPRGVRVRHREGYNAPGALPPTENGLSRTLALGQRVLSGDVGGTLKAEVLALAVDGVGDFRRVAVWVATEGPSFMTEQGGERATGEVFVYALDEVGEIRDFFTQVVDLEQARVSPVLATGALQVLGTLALPPGRHELRVLVRTGAGHEALRSQRVQVPGTASKGMLSPPMFLADARHPLVIVRATEPGTDPETAAARYPFRVGEQTFVPDVRPVLKPGPPHRVVVMAYRLDHGTQAVRARIVRNGAAVEGGELGLVGRSETRPDGFEQLYFQLDSSAFLAGTYALEVVLDDVASGEAVASSTQSFVIEGS